MDGFPCTTKKSEREHEVVYTGQGSSRDPVRPLGSNTSPPEGPPERTPVPLKRVQGDHVKDGVLFRQFDVHFVSGVT